MRRMKSWTLVCFVWACSATALAQEPEAPLPGPEAFYEVCAPDLLGRQRGGWFEMKLEDPAETFQARWFPAPIVHCLVQRLELLPLYAERIQLLEHRLELTELQLFKRAEIVDLARQEADAARNALDEAERLRREAEEDRDAWHRSPLLWAGVGVAAVIILEAIAIWALSAIP